MSIKAMYLNASRKMPDIIYKGKLVKETYNGWKQYREILFMPNQH